MTNDPSPNQRRYPNMTGAGLLMGLLAGAAMGGSMGDFGLWVPLLGVVGLLLGLLLQTYSGDRS